MLQHSPLLSSAAAELVPHPPPPLPGIVPGARPGPPQVLYRGVSDVTVEFMRDGEAAPAFISSIDRPLPDAVRIAMTIEGYGRVDQLFIVGSGR